MAPAATIKLSWRDETGSTGYTTAYILDGTTVAAARQAVETLAGLIGVATGCSLHGYSIQYDTFITDDKGSGAGWCIDVLVLVLSDGNGNYHVAQIPGVLGIYNELGQADPAAPPVLDLAARLGAAPFCNPFGVVCPVVEAAYYEYDPQ